MGAAHNKNRYGELWPQQRIDACLEELHKIKDMVILSGGWAWHFMSPKGHAELKHAHDHKDIDIFVRPSSVAAVVTTLKDNGFEKVWTKYDKLDSDEDFRRYEKVVADEKRPIRITIDFFVSDEIPTRTVDGWEVVEPQHLLSLYRNIHSSDKCFAVQASVKLIAQGIDPVGREELIAIPEA